MQKYTFCMLLIERNIEITYHALKNENLNMKYNWLL